MKPQWIASRVSGTVMLAVVLLCALVCMGACSPDQRAWAERGIQGVEFARGNTTQWYEYSLAQLAKRRAASVEAVIADTQLMMAQGIPTSQPAAGKQVATRPVDAAWVAVSLRTLAAQMDAYDAEKRDLDEKYAMAMRNLDRTGECFVQVERLNKVWAGNGEAIAAQLARLEALIAQQRASGKGRRRRLRPHGRRYRADDDAGGGAGGALAKIEEAIGQAWEQFKLEHPAQARDIENQLGPGRVVLGMQQELAKDQAYEDLVSRTDAEVSIAGLVEKLLPIFATTVTRLLA